jgi:hypothetical protein
LFPPLTMVRCCLDPSTGVVTAKTLHAYPHEERLVFTETTITKP